MKCPSSWKTTRMPSTTRNATIRVMGSIGRSGGDLQPGAGYRARFGVCSKRVVEGRRRSRSDALERLGAGGRDVGEADLPGEKRSDGNLVRGVEDRRRGST